MPWECVQYFGDGRVVFIEIVPEDQDHESSSDCPCGPELLQLCPECNEDPDCWKCEGSGTVPYDKWSGEVPIAVHNDLFQ